MQAGRIFIGIGAEVIWLSVMRSKEIGRREPPGSRSHVDVKEYMNIMIRSANERQELEHKKSTEPHSEVG
jgi:hypothetical protein